MAKVLGAVIGVCFLAYIVQAQRIPNNPCPELFRYRRHNGVYYGEMQFPNDNSGNLLLHVNMSIAAYLNDNEHIELELVTPTDGLQHGAPVVYNVYFPVQYALPKPTNIVFNGQVYCSSLSEPIVPDAPIVTKMWANSILQYRPRSLLPLANYFSSLPIHLNNNYPQTHNTQPVFQPRFGEDQCGYTSRMTHEFIFGGEKTNTEDAPWLTAIMYRNGSNYFFRCGGTLVSDRHVVTAAHCVWYLNTLLSPLEDWLLVFGTNNIDDWPDQAIIREASDIKVHPEYNETTDNDVAVITLYTPVVFDSTVRPACLWNEPDNREAIVGLEGTVVGWGKDESGAISVNEAKRVVMPVVDQEECLRSNAGFLALTSKTTFCAGRRDGVGPCTGDSGGGFIMQRNGKWTLRGIVSTSLALQDGRTCDVHSYYIFADAAKLISWIKSITNNDPRPLL